MSDDLKEIEKFQKLVKTTSSAKSRELKLRKKIAGDYFEEPAEGTNRETYEFENEEGEQVFAEFIMGHKLNRKLDIPAIASIKQAMLNLFIERNEAASMSPEDALIDAQNRVEGYFAHLLEYKPSLRLANYRQFTEAAENNEQVKEELAIFDSLITATPGAPSLTIEFVDAPEADEEE